MTVLGNILDAQKDQQAATPGSLGLAGVWGLIGNSTAMVLLSVVLFIAIYWVGQMHREGIAILERQMERQENSLGKVIERNSEALDNLAGEIRLLRKS